MSADRSPADRRGKKLEELLLPKQDDGTLAWRAWRARKRILGRPDPYSHTLTYWLQALHIVHGDLDAWRPNRAPHAKCQPAPVRSKTGPPQHRPSHLQRDVPEPACTCGYSGYREVDDLLAALEQQKHERIVIGQAVMWGRVLIDGPVLRSAFAYPASAYVVRNWFSWDDDAGLVAESLGQYGIPTQAIHSDELPR